MRKRRIALFLCVTAATTIAGVVMWKAEATPLTGAADSLAVIKSYSAIHRTSCMFGTTRCPAGTKWVCTASGLGGHRQEVRLQALLV